MDKAERAQKRLAVETSNMHTVLLQVPAVHSVERCVEKPKLLCASTSFIWHMIFGSVQQTKRIRVCIVDAG